MPGTQIETKPNDRKETITPINMSCLKAVNGVDISSISKVDFINTKKGSSKDNVMRWVKNRESGNFSRRYVKLKKLIHTVALRAHISSNTDDTQTKCIIIGSATYFVYRKFESHESGYNPADDDCVIQPYTHIHIINNNYKDEIRGVGTTMFREIFRAEYELTEGRTEMEASWLSHKFWHGKGFEAGCSSRGKDMRDHNHWLKVINEPEQDDQGSYHLYLPPNKAKEYARELQLIDAPQSMVPVTHHYSAQKPLQKGADSSEDKKQDSSSPDDAKTKPQNLSKKGKR